MKRMKKAVAVLTAAIFAVSIMGCGASGGNTGDAGSAGEAEKSAAANEEAAGENEQESSGQEAAGGDEITLTFWSWLPTIDQSEEMIAVFEKENPGIKIDYTRTEQDDFFEKLQVAMASGTGPDLFGMTTGPMMEQYAKFSADMKETADEYWSGWDAKISKTAVEQCTASSGTMAGMPLLTAGMTTLMYNKTIMDECGVDKVPTTYEELKDAAAKAKENGYVCVAVGAADDWVNSDWFVQASNEIENGAVYEAERGERQWTDQCFVDTMQAWQNLFTDGIVEDGALGVATYPDARDQYFFARKSMFFLTGSWHLGPTSPSNTEIEGTEIGNQKDIIGMAPFPSIAESGEMLGTSGVDVMICLNQDCEQKEAAMKFIEFLSNGAGQQYWVNQLQGSPVSNEITYQGVVDGELQQQSIDEVNAYVQNAAGSRKLSNSEVEKAIQVAMQNVAAGSDPATELATVQSVADMQ